MKRFLKEFCFSLAALFCFFMPVSAEGEKGIAGGYVTDVTANVAPGSYTTFSTVYNGKRYYLGVDTTAAKSGTYRLSAYNAPCYAAMWQVGGLYSMTGEVLADKNYLRTVKSVYLKGRHSQDAWLALGASHGAYSDMTLATDTANATMWYTEKDNTSAGRYIQGFLYYYNDATGKEVYRYLTYDALYGFSRAYAVKPPASQRVSIWTRTTGDNMSCRFFPETYEFGYTEDTARVAKNFTFTMRLELGVDRFRSQYDGAEFDVVKPTVTDDQQVLRDEKGVTFYVGWSSTHDFPDDDRHHYSVAHLPELGDSVMMYVRDRDDDRTLNVADNRWSDVMYSIGASPKNLPSVTRDHTDYLHIHMTYGGNVYDDSTRVTRRYYKDAPYKSLLPTVTPPDYQFPYFTAAGAGDTQDFTVSAQYRNGSRILGMDGTVVASEVGETQMVDIASKACFRDTVWVKVPDPEDENDTILVPDAIHLLDTLLVSACLPDGTPAVGSSPSQWIASVSLVPATRDRIRVQAKPYTAGSTELRVAQINYSYTYMHSDASDTVRVERTIWVTQLPQTPPEHGLYAFHHQTGKSADELVKGRQQVPELVYTTYAIPDATLPLPIHHDHWGYYRWYIYQNDPAVRYDKDITQKWNYAPSREPVNHRLQDNSFQPINTYSDSYSRGRFDMRSHFIEGLATDIPAVTYKTGDNVLTKTDTLGCDVSAYTDTVSVGHLETKTLSSLTEPTLSYRQLFDIRPAKEMADRMEECRRQADPEDDKYLQEELVIAPRTRTFHLQAYSPFMTGTGIDEGHLQYVYYYNPNEDDNTDENMGSNDGWDDAKMRDGDSYHRIGLPARTTGGDPAYHARLLTLDTIINHMSVGQSVQVVMANPRKGTGYILGKAAGDEARSVYSNGWESVTDSARLRQYIEQRILNPNGTHTPQSNYLVTLTKTANNEITLSKDGKTLYSLFTIIGGGDFLEYNVKWVTPSESITGSNQFEFSDFSSCTDDNLIANVNPGLMKMHVNYRFYVLFIIPTWIGCNGYLTACDVERRNKGSWLRPEYVYDYTQTTNVIDNNGQGYGTTSNQSWCFYEVIAPKDLVEHAEHPKWYRQRSSQAPDTIGYGNPVWTSAHLMPDGSLEASFSYEDETADYWLKSEHFNLAHYKVITREVSQEGPSLTALITEDSIDNHYEVLATLGLELIPAAGTTEVTTPYYHLQWNHTQFAYHYPVGSSTYEVPADRRVTGEALMPDKGEYITTNKFEKAGHATMEACAGAEYGYMFCYNRASKPLVFLDFEMERPACTDQELTLVANFGSPTPGQEPHVTAKMYGRYKGSTEWTLIYNYLTGNLPQSEHWYQVALPLSAIGDYDYYRCVGSVTGTDDNEDAYFLFDRMRLLAKNRPLTIYQKRTTCTRRDSIYIISRIDYRNSDMKPGNIICYQYQKKSGGVYVPMETSDFDGAVYTRRPAATTDVYPGYYKVGMTAEESVTNPDFKSSVLVKDYGTIVVPEHDYDPSKSNETAHQSAVRKAAIDKVQTLLGGDRSAYYDETGRVRPYSLITTAQEIDFGDYDNPQCKFYVNEGTNDNPYWVMYIINRFYIGDSEDATFRIAMQVVDEVNSRPNFSESECSTERIVQAKSPTILSVDEKISGYLWHNYTRSELEDPAYEGDEFLDANSSHIIALTFSEPKDSKYKDGEWANHSNCRFDLLRAFDFMRGYTDMTPSEQAAADAQWEEIYGCTVGEYQDAMLIFRDDDEANPNRRVYSWNNVTRESFHWGTLSHAKCDSAYNLLNRLIVDERLLEVGLSTREVYIGNEQDLYYYVRPIPASGMYFVSSVSGGTDSAVYTPICNDPLWLELHSQESADSLRFGYDRQIGGTYMIPVIRASASVANSVLPVRVAAISDGAVIGWDSTYVVDTNDPAWTASSSFHYAQDRIVQERLYSGYYRKGQTVYFRPVTQAHIDSLNYTGCECLDYDASGTVYDPAHPREHGASGTNVFIRPEAEPLYGCNYWHILPQHTDAKPEENIPGYQMPNNFTLHAGYWYKFKTAFFNTDDVISYLFGDNHSGANRAYFILAVAPDTVEWTPSHPEGTNYWNDDDNWTAVVHGEPFHGALARVPMEDTRVLITPAAQENMFPVVNTDLPGDIERGDVDFGFRTATCSDILFKAHSTIAGQEQLDYHRAFVDMSLPEGQWHTFSPALDYIYSGDLYMPYDTAQEQLFTPLQFEASGINASHNRVWPWLFFQSFYNSAVDDVFRNSDEEGEPLWTQSTRANATWQKTNVLNRPLPAGQVNAVQAWGPEPDITPGTNELRIRLPKQETVYHYYDAQGVQAPADPSLENLDGKPAFGQLTHNLAFDKTRLGAADGVTYRLHNELPAQLFFFGNPTMGLIDLYKLCRDNADVLDGDGTQFIVYELGEDGRSYVTHAIHRAAQFFLQPMHGIGLTAREAATQLDILLRPSAIAGTPDDLSVAAPAHRMQHPQDSGDGTPARLYISAANTAADGEHYKAYMTLGEKDGASDGFVSGEDAVSLLSGTYNPTNLHTPVTLYSLASNRPLMYDCRERISNVPLVLALMTDHYHFSPRTLLSFAIEGSFAEPLYLHDAFRGDSILIANGMTVAVETPGSDRIRYFINGTARDTTGTEQPGLTTGFPSDNGQNNNTQTHDTAVHVYDMLGRKLLTFTGQGAPDLTALPTGVYIIRRGGKTERRVVR